MCAKYVNVVTFNSVVVILYSLTFHNIKCTEAPYEILEHGMRTNAYRASSQHYNAQARHRYLFSPTLQYCFNY